MSFVAVAIGGSAVAGLAGTAMSNDAAEDAADKQAAAAQQANALQERVFNQQRADQEPWRQAGVKALGGMQDADYMRDFTSADFQQDPGYAFRMQEGQKALERSAAAKGGLQSGGTLKALSRYGQDYASNEFQRARDNFNADRDRRFGRLSTLAGMGQGANAQNAAAGQSYASNVGANTMGAADAAGAAGITQANQWGSTLSGLGKVGMDYAAAKNQQTWMDKILKARE